MKIHQHKYLGLTLVELMITLLIATITILLGTQAYSAMRAKQSLRRSIMDLESALIKAQNEAQRRGLWTCLDFSDKESIVVYLDDNEDHGQNASSCGGTDSLLGTFNQSIKSPLYIANCSLNIGYDCKLWIDENGAPMLCSNSGSCGQSISVPSDQSFNCIPWHYQVVISSSYLDSNAKARELEISPDGLIYQPKLGEKGEKETLWAKSGIHSGLGACE
ncbi:MAG TPA: hypothetical protein PKC21_04410 [Oligoflexia bacterium]|nr:hypothetical protein [Oligoflexia bacterium]HMR24580.1 hypothetical protein [Oligoflexia bacterium]